MAKLINKCFRGLGIVLGIFLCYYLCVFSVIFLCQVSQLRHTEMQRLILSIGKYKNKKSRLVFIKRRNLIISKSQIDKVGLDGADVIKKLIDNGWANRVSLITELKEESPTQIKLTADVRNGITWDDMQKVFGERFPTLYPLLEQPWTEQIFAHAYDGNTGGGGDTDPYIEFDDLSLLPPEDIADVKRNMPTFKNFSLETKSAISKCYLIDYEILSKKDEVVGTIGNTNSSNHSKIEIHRTYYIGQLNKVSPCPVGSGR